MQFFHTNEICTRLPKALAYRINVVPEGSFPRTKLFSSLATADCVVPMRAATSACVKPAPVRAATIWSSSASSALASSHSLRKSGSFNDSLSISRQVLVAFIFEFLHTRTRNFQFFYRRLLGFLHKRVQDDDSSTHLSAVKNSSYSVFCSCPQLKKTISHGLCQFIGKTAANDFHPFKKGKGSSPDAVGKSLDLQPDVFIEKVNDVVGSQLGRSLFFFLDRACLRRGCP